MRCGVELLEGFLYLGVPVGGSAILCAFMGSHPDEPLMPGVATWLTTSFHNTSVLHSPAPWLLPSYKTRITS